MKKNKASLTNLVAHNSSYLSSHESERVRTSREASQALGNHSTSDFKATIRMNLMHDNKATAEDYELAKKTFRSGIGVLKGKTTRSKPLPTQSQEIGIPREF